MPTLVSTGLDENLKYFSDMVNFMILFIMFYIPAFCGCLSNRVLRIKLNSSKSAKKYTVHRVLFDSSIFSIVPTIAVMIYHTANHHTPGSQLWILVSFGTGFFGTEISKKVSSLNGLFGFIKELKGLFNTASSSDILKEVEDKPKNDDSEDY